MAFLKKLSIIVLLLVNLVAGVKLYGVISETTPGGTGIVFEDDSPERAAFTEYIAALDADVERLLRPHGSRRVTIPVRIEVLKESLPDDWVIMWRGRTAVFRVSGDYADFWRDREFRCALAKFLLLAKVNLRPDGWMEKFPRFIADGVNSRVALRTGRDYLMNTAGGYFPGLRAAVLAGKKVDLSAVLSEPDGLIASGGAVADFYDEVARYMLDLLYTISGNGGSNALEDFIILSCQGNSFNDVFAATVGRWFQTAQLNPVIEAGGMELANSGATQRMELGIAVKPSSQGGAVSLDELLSRYMEMRVFNLFNPYPASEVARRFGEFRVLRYELEENGEKRAYTADILDLPRLYAEHEECRLLPSEKQGELAMLLHAPPLLALEQLRACADALNEIGRLPMRDSQEKLSSAVTAVETRLEQALLVEAELDKAEREYLPFELNYPEFFNNALESGGVLTPEGEAFLDEQESLLGGR